MDVSKQLPKNCNMVLRFFQKLDCLQTIPAAFLCKGAATSGRCCFDLLMAIEALS